MSRNALSNANAHRPTDRNATTYGVVNGSGEKVERETENPVRHTCMLTYI